jgi:Rrf2 family protein
MRISAKVDYALRAVVELACAEGHPIKAEQVAAAQQIPLRFLENILHELKHEGIVAAQRGSTGGYTLGRGPGKITLADVIRAVDGPLANIKGKRPEELAYVGAAQPLQTIWVAVRANLRAVLEKTTIDDLTHDRLSEEVRALAGDADAWVGR